MPHEIGDDHTQRRPVRLRLALIAGSALAAAAAAALIGSGAALASGSSIQSVSGTSGITPWYRSDLTVSVKFSVTPPPSSPSSGDHRERIVSVTCSGPGVTGGWTPPNPAVSQFSDVFVSVGVVGNSPDYGGTPVQCTGSYEWADYSCFFNCSLGAWYAVSPAIFQATFKIDKTAPTLTVGFNPPAPVVGQSVTTTVIPSDTLSGILSTSCTPLHPPTTNAGPNGASCTATDGAGNIAGASGSFTTGKASTTAAITSGVSSAVVGESDVVSFTVAVNSPGAGTPTGTVTVSDGVDSCQATVAVGFCNLTLTTTGDRDISATYPGDTRFLTSTSSSVLRAMSKAFTTTAITSGPDAAVVGQTVSVSYAVSVTAPGAGTPTGTVTVSDGTNSCQASVAAGHCDLTLTTVGSRPMTASYPGDTRFRSSASASVTRTVSKPGTTTSVTSGPDTAVVGESRSVSYSVAVTAPGAGTPTGTVTVTDGVNGCSASVAAGQCSLTLTTVGARSITASYTGDASFQDSTSAAVTRTVGKAGTTTTITSGSGTSAPGVAITVAYSVDVTAPGAGTPTGTVTVSDGIDSCQASVAAGHCDLTLDTPGDRAVTASYAGDASFQPSDSSSVSRTVSAAGSVTTVSPVAASVIGTPVSVTFHVLGAPGTSGTPTGSVTVSSGSLHCSASVSTGNCALTFTSKGTKTVTASYPGDGAFAPSQGSASVVIRYPFAWKSPLHGAPTVDYAKPGATVAIQFSLKGDRGTAVITAGYPRQAAASCSSWARTSSWAKITGKLSHSRGSSTYSVPWVTSKRWTTASTRCRLVGLSLNDGTSHTLRIRFTPDGKAPRVRSTTLPTGPIGTGGAPTSTSTSTTTTSSTTSTGEEPTVAPVTDPGPTLAPDATAAPEVTPAPDPSPVATPAAGPGETPGDAPEPSPAAG